MYPVLPDVCQKFSKFLRDQRTDGVEIRGATGRYTISVVSNLIYGIDANAFETELATVHKMGSTIFQLGPAFHIVTTLHQMLPFLKNWIRISMTDKKVEKYFTNLMDDVIRVRQETGIERDDYLAYLLELQRKKNLSYAEMAAHTMSFFTDGFETSSFIISMALFRLASNADIQQKLRREIGESIERHGTITFDSIGAMEYLEMVLNGK